MKRTVFENKYYFEFTFAEIKRNKIIIPENELPEYMYFIKEGEIEITFNANFFQLIDAIRKIASLINFQNLDIYDYQFQNLGGKYYFIKFFAISIEKL